jgi:hypothetical protein
VVFDFTNKFLQYILAFSFSKSIASIFLEALDFEKLIAFIFEGVFDILNSSFLQNQHF